jgi:hypothetical protein
MKKTSLAATSAAVAILGVVTVLTPVSAITTYSQTTNIIMADGTIFDSTNRDLFVNDTDNTVISIVGTIQDVRDTMVKLSDYINPSNSGSLDSAMVAKLAVVTEVNLVFADATATLSTEDISYINYLKGLISNTAVQTVVNGNIDLSNIKSADVDGFVFGDVDITLADDADIETFFGKNVPSAGTMIQVGDKVYEVAASGGFVEVQKAEVVANTGVRF